MELTFLGRGAGFNPAEGSTSSYFIDNKELFLIDCGESIFKTILEKKLLDSVSVVNLFITHTHTDHVGSLGSLILYSSVIKKLPVKIITSECMGYLPKLKSFLEIVGLTSLMYDFADVSAFTGNYKLFNKVNYFKTTHCDELESCGILFETESGLVFYSGDLNNPGILMDIIKSGRKIDKIYVDSSNDRKINLHHITIHQLNDIIPSDLKSKIYCMHINNDKCIEEALAYGFNVVQI